MAQRDLAGMRWEDRFKTVGALRAAAFRLATATKGLRCEQLAVELHDSICAVLTGPPGMRLRDAVKPFDGEAVQHG